MSAPASDPTAKDDRKSNTAEAEQARDIEAQRGRHLDDSAEASGAGELPAGAPVGSSGYIPRGETAQDAAPDAAASPGAAADQRAAQKRGER